MSLRTHTPTHHKTYDAIFPDRVIATKRVLAAEPKLGLNCIAMLVRILVLCCLLAIFSGGFAFLGSNFFNQWKGVNLGTIIRNTHAAALNLYDNDYDRIYPTDTLPTLGLNLTQNLVPDIAYYYLQNTLNLPEETMWKITLEAGSILGSK